MFATLKTKKSAIGAFAALVALVLMGLMTATALAQPLTVSWIDQFGTSEVDAYIYVNKIAPDGTIVVGGSTDGALAGVSAGSTDAFIRKYNADGDVLWTRQFGTADIDRAYDVEFDSLGNIYVLCIKGDLNTPVDVCLQKFNSAGTPGPSTTFGFPNSWEIPMAMKMGPDGNLYITGYTDTAEPMFGIPDFRGKDGFILKYSNDLALLGGTRFGTPDLTTALGRSVYPFAIALDDSGNIYVSGETNGAFGDGTTEPNPMLGDLFVAKFNSSFVRQWVRQTDSPDSHTERGGFGLVVDSSAGVLYTIGSTAGSIGGVNPFPTAYDVVVMKHNTSTGGVIWSSQFGSVENEIVGSIGGLAGGTLYVLTDTVGLLGASSAGGKDIVIAMLDADTGSIIAFNQFGTPGDDSAGALAVAGTSVYATHSTDNAYPTKTNQGLTDAVLIKFTTGPSDDSDNDGVKNAAEEALTGSATGLTLNTTGTTVGTLSGVLNADSSVTISGQSTGFNNIVSATFPVGSTVPLGELTFKASKIGNKEAVTVKGVVLPAGTTKSVELKNDNEVCIVDSPDGVEVGGLTGGQCKTKESEYKVKINCDGLTKTFSAFPDGTTRNFKCTKLNGYIRVEGLRNTEVQGFEDADNDGVDGDFDLCPNTAAGATVEANGCAAGQTPGNVLSFGTVTAHPGNINVVIPLLLNNSQITAGLQFKANLSSVTTFKQTNIATRADGAIYDTNLVNGIVNAALVVPNNIAVGQGPILNFVVDVSPSAAPGDYPLTPFGDLLGDPNANALISFAQNGLLKIQLADTVPPVISNNPVTSPTNNPSLTVSGTVTDPDPSSGLASFTINGAPVPLSSTGGSGSGEASIVTVDPNANVSVSLAAAVGSDSNARIVHSKLSGGTNFVRCANADCSTPVITGQISPLGGADIALDSNGLARIMVSSVHYRCSNQNCSPKVETVVDPLGDASSLPALVLGSDGFVRTIYRISGGELRYALCTDIDCANKVISPIDSAVHGKKDIALDNNGLANMVYFVESPFPGKLNYARCADPDCASKTTTTVFSDASNIPQVPQIALGSDNLARISFHRLVSGGSQLEYIRCTNPDCTTNVKTVVIPVPGISPTFSMSLDGNDLARFSHSNGLDLSYTRCANADCTAKATQLLDNSESVGTLIAMALDSNGVPRIAYNEINSKRLKHALCLNADCAAVSTGPIASGSYSHTLTLVEGPNTITEVATDNAGNQSTVIKQVELITDTVPPVISNNPVTSTTNNPSLTVSGTVTDPAPSSGIASLTINGAPVTLGAGGAYSSTLTLTEGLNVITEVATDNKGNASTVTKQILLDTQAPTVVKLVGDPDNDGFVNSITLKASDTPKSPATVASGVKEIHYSINGGAETIVVGASANVVLPQGTPQITISFFAVDNAGNQELPTTQSHNLDQCAVAGPYQGCPFGDKNIVDLHIVNLGGGASTKSRLAGAEVRVFDRNNLDFQAVAGSKNPDGSLYGVVYEADAGRVGTCTTGADGACTAGEQTTGDYLVIVKWFDAAIGKTVYVGRPKSPADFKDTNADGIGDLATKDFQIMKTFNKNGVFQGYRGGSKLVVTGSLLEMIVPESAFWEGTSSIYPFIFTSDSDWTVDVCAEVPIGYTIVGVYDENGNLISNTQCVQTIVANTTKIVAFEVNEVGSPEPSLSATLTLKNPKGQITKLSHKASDLRKNTFNEKVKAAQDKAQKLKAIKKPQSLAPDQSLWRLVANNLTQDSTSTDVEQGVRVVAQENDIAIPEWGITGRVDAKRLLAGTLINLAPLQALLNR